MKKLRTSRRTTPSWSGLACLLLWGIGTAALGKPQLSAQEGRSFQLPQDASLIIKLKNMKQGQAPFVSHNLLFFAYQGTQSTKAVGIAFESEGFAEIKMLERNAHDVFLYSIPLPTEGRVAYRYWVDGLWQQDPANPHFYLDNYEVPISLFESEDPSQIRSNNPIEVTDGYDFYAYFDPGKHVYILGNFNNWDPFISPLQELEPGKYYIRIPHLKPGKYQYYFRVGGLKHLDSRNYRVAVNNQGEKVSVFTVTPES